ncbi:MAG: DNA recombination/repair protein RecA [Bryobacterales bacterium]|nr:DNA recombination/repair protein RecA [Bryobacterales bacterium]
MSRPAKVLMSDAAGYIRTIATGCLSLDWVLGVGGFPRGHLVEIFGDPDSGKTTLGLEAIASAQRDGGVAAFLDSEHTLDLLYAARLGVDLERLVYSRPTAVHEAFELMRALVKTCAVDVIVLDSVAALGPAESIVTASLSKAFSTAFDYWSLANGILELSALAQRSPCCIILINQTRLKRGKTPEGSEITPGSPTLSHAASLRIRLERLRVLAHSGETIGSRCAARVLKNSIGPSGRQTELRILGSGGVSREADLLALGFRSGTISRSEYGLYFRGFYLGTDAWQALHTLQEDATARNMLTAELCSRANLSPSESSAMMARKSSVDL